MRWIVALVASLLGCGIDTSSVEQGLGSYVLAEHHTAGWVQEITDFDGTLLVSDQQGPMKGVYRLDTGFRYTTDPYTEWHAEKDGRILTGTSGTVPTLRIVGVDPMVIPYPVGFSVYHAGAWGDVDCDGNQDVVISGIRSDVTTSTLVALRGPAFTDVLDIAGPLIGEKHDNVKLYFDAVGCVAAIATTEEKTEGVLVFFPDGLGGWVRTYAAPWSLCKGADGVDLGDFDKDGDLDIISACERHSSLTPSVVVSVNNGDGTYSPMGLGLTNLAGPEDVIWWDEDGDTWLDALVGESVGKKVRLFRNDEGVMSTSPELLVSPTNGLPMRLHATEPGTFWVGSYSTGASLDRWELPL